MEVEDLKELIASRLDVTEFLDALGWTMYELVDALNTEVFAEHFDDLMDACG